MMNHDMELLREYALRRSERAFETLVSRHIHLVHSAALRQVRDPDLAEEITQVVFIILVQKAGSLSPKTILPGWLYRTTRFTAANAIRTRANRQRREQEAYMQSQLEESAPAVAWQELSPLLDEAMEGLGQTNRDALVLRFFENKNLSEVGLELGLGEKAAQKRVTRGLEKLRVFFAKRGVKLSTALVASTIAAHSVQAAPTALIKSVGASALAQGTAATGSTLSLTKITLKTMAWTKAKISIGAILAALTLAGLVTVSTMEYSKHTSYPWQVPKAEFSTLYDSPPQVAVVPSRFIKSGGSCSDGTRGAMGIAQPLQRLIEVAYDSDSLHTVITVSLPTNRYDYFAKLVPARKSHVDMPKDNRWRDELRHTVEKQFGIVAVWEPFPTDVLLLRETSSGAKNLNPGSKLGDGIAFRQSRTGLELFAQPISILAKFLESKIKTPIIDNTGLNESYNLSLKWPESVPTPSGFKEINRALVDQLGLELIATNMPMEMLVVKKR